MAKTCAACICVAARFSLCGLGEVSRNKMLCAGRAWVGRDDGPVERRARAQDGPVGEPAGSRGALCCGCRLTMAGRWQKCCHRPPDLSDDGSHVARWHDGRWHDGSKQWHDGTDPTHSTSVFVGRRYSNNASKVLKVPAERKTANQKYTDSISIVTAPPTSSHCLVSLGSP